MTVKPLNTAKPKSKIEPFLPVLITSGPLFLWMGLENGIEDSVKNPHSMPFWLTHGVAMAGLFMLMFGLVLLKIRQDQLEKRLDELERRRN